ncbi:hypothetical protein VPNG_05156 [Cytospora leucostoma]|uniref:Uncharacterized protein n=1 Tax=Cytospora leucostoma TaxID=1230097 RepID=A0A423X4K3_9PEZI|nr:hypothetical protein VPNG_05156 [Cytospora leucostoma]
MDEDRRSDYGHCQPGHPKAERAQLKEKASQLMAKRPVYPLTNRRQFEPTDRALPGDTEAHRYDDDELCRKLLPRDDQERRGCKARDVDRRRKSWNKKVYVGVVEEAWSFADSDVDLMKS